MQFIIFYLTVCNFFSMEIGFWEFVVLKLNPDDYITFKI